jgi:uncharacterized lipoprotein YmbA
VKALALVAAALLAAACGSTPATRYYTLGSPPVSMPATAETLSVFVGPVTIPEEIDRTAVVVRTGPNQVEILDLDRWAEPLKAAIPRVLAEGLMASLGTPRVFASRQGANQPVDFRVAVEVRRFDYSRTEGASLDAVWTVTSAKGAIRSGRTVASEAAGGDLQAMAAAQTRLLQKLAAEVTGGVRALR